MRVLLLSAYDAASHRYWHQGLCQAFPQWQWQVLGLPPRYFNWRVRGNSLSWAFQEREILTSPYDLLICTSMVDLSALRGFVPALATIPTLVYFHENQFAYPRSSQQFESVEPQLLSIYTALCADVCVFNSAYNKTSFLDGAEKLLRKLPDHVPAGVLDKLQDSPVLPVPLSDEAYVARSTVHDKNILDVLWNHRWEYDKGPERLYHLLCLLVKQPLPVRLHICGQQFRQEPAVFEKIGEIAAAHPELVARFAYIDDPQQYQQLLCETDIVLSTALHDFQGLSVLQAVAAGAYPLLPNRLVYPEFFPSRCLYASSDDVDAEVQDLYRRLQALCAQRSIDSIDIATLSWRQQRAAYQHLLQSLATGGSG